ncbi:MAG: radical SAM protein [Muribaculaceae bacterium]|nr:radical SAM protein [Muribaculaceae bacterium]MDE6810699.1 radical SAM protein [Muribaculaceae bacterium]
MQTVLFTSTIFGPIHSRRLGVSLGINLMPRDGKVCTFDCLYCEAGFNAQGPGKAGIPPRAEVKKLLEEKLADMKKKGEPLDVITFSGNGEPTLHPDFGGVINDTIELRDRYFPDVKISVLSNSTRIDRPDVVEALKRVDNNILKLDSAIDSTVQIIDRPTYPAYNVRSIVDSMKQFDGSFIIQTMFLRGTHDGVNIDNTTDSEVDALIDVYNELKPREIMIYSIDRKTPAEHLQKVEKPELEAIAEKIRRRTGVKVQVA